MIERKDVHATYGSQRDYLMNTSTKTDCTARSEAAGSSKKCVTEDLLPAVDSTEEILQDPLLLDFIQTPAKNRANKPPDLCDEDIIGALNTPLSKCEPSKCSDTTIANEKQVSIPAKVRSGRIGLADVPVKPSSGNDAATQTSPRAQSASVPQGDILGSLLDKLTRLEQGLASLRKHVVAERPAKPAKVEEKKADEQSPKATQESVPEGVLMTASRKPVKLSQTKIQRASMIFKDTDNDVNDKAKVSKKSTMSPDFDEELSRILSSKRPAKNRKTFVPPSSIKQSVAKKQSQNAPLSPSQEELILSLLDADDSPKSHPQSPVAKTSKRKLSSKSPSKEKFAKLKSDPVSDQTIIDQHAVLTLRSIILKCDQELESAPASAEFTHLKEKHGSERLSISSAEVKMFSCYCHQTGEENRVCTLCSNTGLIGYTQIYAVWRELLKDNLSIVPPHSRMTKQDWVKAHYRLVVWRLDRFADASVLTLPNVVCKLVKRYRREFTEKKPSFLQQAVMEPKHTIQMHCVLMVTDVINKGHGLELELTDGQRCLKSVPLPIQTEDNSNDTLIGRLIEEGKIFVGQKLHIINAKLVEPKVKIGKSYFDLQNECKISLNYNGISPADRKSKLGLQKKGWLYKPISSLSQYSGEICMIDAILVSKSKAGTVGKALFIDSLSELDPHKCQQVEVNLNEKFEDTFNLLSEGNRYKLFNLVPQAPSQQKNGILYLESGERTKIRECGKSSLQIRNHQPSAKTNPGFREFLEALHETASREPTVPAAVLAVLVKKVSFAGICIKRAHGVAYFITHPLAIAEVRCDSSYVDCLKERQIVYFHNLTLDNVVQHMAGVRTPQKYVKVVAGSIEDALNDSAQSRDNLRLVFRFRTDSSTDMRTEEKDGEELKEETEALAAIAKSEELFHKAEEIVVSISNTQQQQLDAFYQN